MLKVKKDIEKRSLILSVLLVFILSLFYFFFNKKIRAEIVYFYPESCLGSFVNPEKAEGKPEVENSDLISESNSAVYLGGFKEIYCGNFQGPIEEGKIQSITLKFNMVLTNERRETPITQSTSSESLIEKIIPPKTIEIINTSTENSTNTAPESPPTSTIEIPQSFFYKIVFAEETTNQESTSSNENLTSEQTSVTPTTEEIINTTTQETTTTTQETVTSTQELSTTTPISTTTPEEITSTTQLEQTLNYFDIFYTLDGQTWEYLGSITNKNSQNISFSIPVNDWLMIPKIQIKVQSNPTLENIPYLYLESMSLEVEYNLKEDKDEENISLESTDCLEFQKKMNSYLTNDKSSFSNLLENVISSENNEIIENKKEIIELVSQDLLAENVFGYQFNINKNKKEFWLINKSLNICKKIENFESQNVAKGFYENIFFYLDDNKTLNGYDIISDNKFSITFENNMKISFLENKKVKVVLRDNHLNFIEIEVRPNNE